MRAAIVGAVLMAALPAQADGMASFFADAKNEQGYQVALAAGQIGQARTRMLDACQAAKASKPAADCVCVDRELAAVPDREFFYESVVAYREYRDKVDALRDEDTARFEQLKAQHAQRMSLARRLEAACGKI